jgi:hypothetical protein
MIHFYLKDFVWAWENFNEEFRKHSAIIESSSVQAGSPLSREEINRLITIVARIKVCCGKADCEMSINQIYLLEVQLNNEVCTYQTVKVLMQGISETIISELGGRLFVFIPQKQSEFFENENLFGAGVSDAFPSARADIKNAGNCMAAELHDAAVFHIMRVVEYGLRALANHLQIPVSGDELEYEGWNTVINQIYKKVKDLTESAQGTKKEKAKKREFYSGIMGEFSGFKDEWRNSIMHTRGKHNEDEARNVYKRVSDFMYRLAKGGISE